MKNDLVKQVDKWLDENGNFGRDVFLNIMSVFKDDLVKELSITFKGKFFNVVKPQWFDDVINFRKLYEQVLEYRNGKEDVPEDDSGGNKDIEVKLCKKIQTLTDENNLLKKRIKKILREINNSENFTFELLKSIEKIEVPKINGNISKININNKGIIHLSDLHFDMLINEPDNKYNFDIASKRLKKFIQGAKKILLDNNVAEVIVVNTGDTITSNRRDSEKYNRATSRGNALIIATKLLSYALLDLTSDFKVSYATCCGNESRIDMSFEYDVFSMSDNFDIMIYNILKLMMGKVVNFIDTDTAEGVLKIDYDYNILITHGNNIPDNNLQRKIMQIIGKFASKDINIKYVLFGDKHCCLISDIFARCASLCGGNAYSTKQLGFSSRASQNVYIYDKIDKSISGIKIDVQDVVNVDGYDIHNELKEFNIKGI